MAVGCTSSRGGTAPGAAAATVALDTVPSPCRSSIHALPLAVGTPRPAARQGTSSSALKAHRSA